MGKWLTKIIVLVVILICLGGAFFFFNNKKVYLKPVNNQIYKDHCGACHFAYQPELLPDTSWEKLLAKLDDHFGEIVKLDGDSKKIIADYLESNDAQTSQAARAVKIMRSLKKDAPLRITDIPYIRDVHHDEFSPDVLNRKSVGSLSNCSACHTTAENGIYDDRYVEIPK